MAKLKHVLKTTNGKCWYCGLPASTRDHIQPQSKGGLSTPWNLVPACRYCNSMKGEQTLEEFRAYIRDWRVRRVKSPKENALRIESWGFRFWFEVQQLEFPKPPEKLPSAGAYPPHVSSLRSPSQPTDSLDQTGDLLLSLSGPIPAVCDCSGSGLQQDPLSAPGPA